MQDYSLLNLITNPRNTRTEGQGLQWQTVGVHSLVYIWVLRAMTADKQHKWFLTAASILAANFRADEAISNNLVSYLEHIRGKQPIGSIYESQCYLSKERYFIALKFADIYTREGYFKEAKLVGKKGIHISTNPGSRTY